MTAENGIRGALERDPKADLRNTRELLTERTEWTLNGNPARISGHRKQFATVTDTTTRLSAEWSWAAVALVWMNRGPGPAGAGFRS